VEPLVGRAVNGWNRWWVEPLVGGTVVGETVGGWNRWWVEPLVGATMVGGTVVGETLLKVRNAQEPPRYSCVNDPIHYFTRNDLI